jgi:hypothetical protein
MDIFTSREIALSVWSFILTGFVLSKAPTRKAAVKVLAALFNNHLLRVYAVTTAYILLIIFILAVSGLWNPAHLKSTIIWFFSVAILSLFRLPQMMEDFSYFKKTAADNLKIIVAVEFIISSYTLALWQELLLLPFIAFVSGMLGVTNIKPEFQIPKYKPVKTLLNSVLAIIGLGFIGSAIFQIVGDINGFASVGTLSDFALPPILTFLFLPYLFLLAVYAVYETVFSVMRITIKNEEARRYAHFASIMAFRTNVELLKRWKRDIGVSNPKTKDEVRTTINDVLERRKREQNPAKIPLEKGWSPYEAKNYLTGHGLNTGEYHKSWPDSDEWYASSPLVEIDQGIFPNNIAYYVDGDQTTTKQLKIAINVNAPESAQQAHEKLALTSKELTKTALEDNLPDSYVDQILSGTEFTIELAGKSVSLARENFRNKSEQYKLSFMIESPVS